MNTPTRQDAVISDTDAANERTDTREAEAMSDTPVEQLPEVPAPEVKVEQPAEVQQDLELSEDDQRLAKLDAIASTAIEGEVITPVHAEPGPEVVEPEPEPEPEPDSTDDLPVKMVDGKYVVPITVDGEEQLIPFDQIRADAQKVNAADKRFREASALMKKIEESNNAQQTQQLPVQDVAPQALPQGEQPQAITAETLNKAMLDGDESSQHEIVNRLNQAPQEQLSPAQYLDQVDALRRTRDAIDLVSNMDPVNIEIAANQEELMVVDSISAMLLQTQPDLTEQQNLEKSFDMAKVQLGKTAPVKDEPIPSAEPTLQKRQAAKKNHASGNLAASSQRTSVGVDAPVYNHKTEVNTMREQRKAMEG